MTIAHPQHLSLIDIIPRLNKEPSKLLQIPHSIGSDLPITRGNKKVPQLQIQLSFMLPIAQEFSLYFSLKIELLLDLKLQSKEPSSWNLCDNQRGVNSTLECVGHISQSLLYFVHNFGNVVQRHLEFDLLEWLQFEPVLVEFENDSRRGRLELIAFSSHILKDYSQV